MWKKLSERKRKILRRVYGALSLSSTLFVFQACYGMPHDYGQDLYIAGVVKSTTTNLPISGIKVSIANQPQYEVTDSTGSFKMYTSTGNEESVYCRVIFQDIDSIQHGEFLTKDTIVKLSDESIFLNVSLDDK
jgi:hypothetical protein